MAQTVLQNCQRIVIMMQFITIGFVIIFLTIRLIKKKIDLHHNDQQQPNQSSAKYKEGQQSSHQFDKAVIKSTTFKDEDTCTERIIKKVCEYSLTFNSLFITFPLAFVLGTTKSFLIVMYFFAATTCILFNVFKVHRACIENKVLRGGIECLWILFSILFLINNYSTINSSMPYTLKQG